VDAVRRTQFTQRSHPFDRLHRHPRLELLRMCLSLLRHLRLPVF
jgi:hypothetical protein